MSHPCNTQLHQLPQAGLLQLQASSVLFHSDAVGTGCRGQLPCAAMCAHTPSNKCTLRTTLHQWTKLRRLPPTMMWCWAVCGTVTIVAEEQTALILNPEETEGEMFLHNVSKYTTPISVNSSLASNCHSYSTDNLKSQHTFKNTLQQHTRTAPHFRIRIWKNFWDSRHEFFWWTNFFWL